MSCLKNYRRQKVYISLIVIKVSLFLIQPIIIGHQLNNALIVLSISVIFIIDFHIMTLKNKTNLKEVHLTKQEKDNVFEQYKKSWFLMGSVVLLFALYVQFNEGNYTIIFPFSLLYLLFVLGEKQPKIKYVVIQLFGLLAVYLLANIDAPVLIKGTLLIFVLMIIYQAKKFIYHKEGT